MAFRGPVDALLSFGELALSEAGTELPNTLDLNVAQTERMSVKVQVAEAAAGGTSVTVTLKGSDNGSSFTTIGAAKTVALAGLTEGAEIALPIPDGLNNRYLKVEVTKSGTFTKGKLTGYIDTYLGL